MILPEKPNSRSSIPRLLEFHHIGEGTARIQKAAGEQQQDAVRCSVFERRDYIAIGNIFTHHFADSYRRRIRKVGETRRLVKLHVPQRRLARKPHLPLRAHHRGE